MKQEVFQKVYRGRQSLLHHASYLRMSKVLLILNFIKKNEIQVEKARVLDYGFGSGTLLRYFPSSASIFGLEQDPVLCQEVTGQLAPKGFKAVKLEPIDVEHNDWHPLLQGPYDLIICSHVLEHLENPAFLLKQFSSSLEATGGIVGVIPIHERKHNPHHLLQAGRTDVEKWAKMAGLKLEIYEEGDPWLYWLQYFYVYDYGWRHRLAQAISIALGVPATILGPSAWAALGKVFRSLSGSLPTQAIFWLRLA